LILRGGLVTPLQVGGLHHRARRSISTILFLVLVVISVLLGPETKGKTLTADLEVIKGVAQPAT
jgi:hypothetical protein